MASLVTQFGIALPVGILLARLLMPADFGLAALSLIVIGFVSLAADLGLGAALIQRRDLTDRHIRVALTGSVVLGVLIAALIAATAPAIAQIAGNPALASLLRVQSLTFIAAGPGVVAGSVLQRRLDYRSLFFAEVGSYACGYALVATIGALSGFGVWSLVVGSLAQGFLLCVLSFRAGGLPLRPLLSRRELGELLSFGIGISASTVFSYVGRNGDNFFVGRMLGTAMLGYYSRAFNWMMMPINYVTSVLFNILVPTFAEIQNDRRRIGKGFVMSVEFAAIIVLPVAVVMIVAAPHLILGLYGSKWAGTIRPLQILCIVAFPRAVHPLAGAVNRACNRVAAEFWLQLGFAAAIVTAAIGGVHYGLVGVAASVSVAIALMFVGHSALALQFTESTWRAFLKAHVPGALVGLFSGVVALAVRGILEHAGCSHLTILFGLVLSGAVSVLTGVYLLPSRIRPRALFAHLATPLSKLPAPFRYGAMFVLRNP